MPKAEKKEELDDGEWHRASRRGSLHLVLFLRSSISLRSACVRVRVYCRAVIEKSGVTINYVRGC